MLNRFHLNTIASGLLIFLIITSCGSKKQVGQADTIPIKPSWVNKKPIDQAYYYGVGKADKKYHASDYQQTAKKFALEDLSSEIEVKLDAQSVLYQKETSRDYFETYQAITQIEVSQSISGFEPVDSWNNENEYWVLYRLSKSKYRQIEADKRNQAITQAIHYIDEAENALDNKSRFEKLLLGLQSIESYLNEPLETTYNNSSIYLGNYITNNIEEMFDGLSITSSKESIDLNFQNCYSSRANWSLQFNNLPVNNLPVRIKFKTYTAQQTISDKNGLISYTVEAHFFENTPPIVELWVATADLVDDKLLQSLFNEKYASNRLTVSIKKPVFLIESENGKGIIQQEIIKAGGKVTNEEDNADIALKFKFNITELGKSNDFYTNKCETIVAVKSKNNEVNFQKNWPPAKGVHLNQMNAREKAIENSLEQINYRWFQDLILDICK